MRLQVISNVKVVKVVAGEKSLQKVILESDALPGKEISCDYYSKEPLAVGKYGLAIIDSFDTKESTGQIMVITNESVSYSICAGTPFKSEMKQTSTGKSVMKFTIGCSANYKRGNEYPKIYLNADYWTPVAFKQKQIEEGKPVVTLTETKVNDKGYYNDVVRMLSAVNIREASKKFEAPSTDF